MSLPASDVYDLVIIGSGPGGHAAALTASRRGLRTALIERGEWGGDCLNVGCIPTKALIAVARRLDAIRRAEALGIDVGPPSLDYRRAHARNGRIIAGLRDGLAGLLKQQRVELLRGEARFLDPQTLQLTSSDGAVTRLTARRAVIATGAQPNPGPWRFDGERILSYRDLLAMTSLPASLLIIGAGAIGCEFASCLSMMGVRVSIIEQQPQLLPTEDPEASRALARQLEGRGVQILTSASVRELSIEGGQVRASLVSGAALVAERCLIAIGLRPNVHDLGLEALGIAATGGIEVNRFLITAQPHIAAIGDCLRGHGLAHVASAEGALAVRNLLDPTQSALDHRLIPRCVYTDPEIASVGLCESQMSRPYRISRFSFAALGKSLCDEQSDGFVKLLADASTDRLHGVTVVGAEASTLIHPTVIAMQHELTAAQLGRTITAHPTWAEAITEAAAQVHGEALFTGQTARVKSPAASASPVTTPTHGGS